jgi:hypothetical protein
MQFHQPAVLFIKVFCCGIHELTRYSQKRLWASILPTSNQVRLFIAVHINPGCIGYHAYIFQFRIIFCGFVGKVALAIIYQNIAFRCFGIAARYYPAAYKQIGEAIAVNIGRFYTAFTADHFGQSVGFGKIRFPLPSLRYNLSCSKGIIGFIIGITARTYIQVGLAIAIGIKKNSRGIGTIFIGIEKQQLWFYINAYRLLLQVQNSRPPHHARLHRYLPGHRHWHRLW